MVIIKGDLCNAIEMIYIAVRIEAMEFVLQQTMNANADRDDVSVIRCKKSLSYLF